MSSSPHIRCGDNTRRIMLDVLIALLPTLLAGTIFFGLRCLLLAAVSIAAAGLAEALWNKLTGRYQTVEDLSAAVTGLLLALTLPATVPYWMAAVGAVFAVIVVKAAFGGLGQNIFNPALAARALLLLLLLVSLGWQLVRINRQVETAQAQKEELAEQVESRQAENDALRADIADGGSQEKKEEIARDELGMVAPGERVFVVN